MKIGDSVKIVDSFKNFNCGIYDIVPEMQKYLGKETFIVESFADNFYLLDIDESHWLWHQDLIKTI